MAQIIRATAREDRCEMRDNVGAGQARFSISCLSAPWWRISRIRTSTRCGHARTRCSGQGRSYVSVPRRCPSEQLARHKYFHSRFCKCRPRRLKLRCTGQALDRQLVQGFKLQIPNSPWEQSRALSWCPPTPSPCLSGMWTSRSSGVYVYLGSRKTGLCSAARCLAYRVPVFSLYWCEYSQFEGVSSANYRLACCLSGKQGARGSLIARSHDRSLPKRLGSRRRESQCFPTQCARGYLRARHRHPDQGASRTTHALST
ncbi:hypothetical protein B0H21DRAFT_378416 [Amylocystis lapponica]|nr:hypothetical protein B0H21DRAFT_378416 [Amylocystis lapponica]